MMIDLIYLVAVACGCVAALRGNHTAAALLMAEGVTTLLSLTVGFNPFLWMAVNLGVIWIALRPHLSLTNIAVIVLYIPMWPLYTQDGWSAYYGVSLLTSLQFLVTFPLSQVCLAIKRKVVKSDDCDNTFKLTT